MKVPLEWLAEWIEAPWSARELGARLTMAGFELESIEWDEPDDPHGCTLEFGITPNRGDAMSIRGIAREVAALSDRALKKNAAAHVSAKLPDVFPVELTTPAACPKFVGRVIRGIDSRADSPAWLRERLRRCGVRSIHPVVDATNYLMLELGTPMHAYDLAKLRGSIEVRFARAGEELLLLDGQQVKFDASAASETLLIADRAGPVGIAGVMGGKHTAVNETTMDVFLEVAYFSPEVIGPSARRNGLISDAAQRFERGVDPQAQEQAIEQASALLQQIAGGQCGPVVSRCIDSALPRPPQVRLRRRQITRLVGMDVTDDRVERSLAALGMQVEKDAAGWRVSPPSHRFDIAIEADLIEEVARLLDYASIPETPARALEVFAPAPEARLAPLRAVQIMADRGYQEAITYSFVDPQLQARLFPGVSALPLRNPLVANQSVMRHSLWPGLLQIVSENLRRQHERVRLVERGNKFVVDEEGLREVPALAGIAVGGAWPEQWGEPSRPVDFFDVKGDVEAILQAAGGVGEFTFQAQQLTCLHPARAARVLRRGTPVGWIGELHPEQVKALDLGVAPVLFELEVTAASLGKLPVFQEISRLPSIRRDLAVVVDESVTLAAIEAQVTHAAGPLLRDLVVFDVYRGRGIDSGRKSVALGLILQGTSRTLSDSDADRILSAVLDGLRRELNASIRD